jgi:RecB family exonuclease
MTDEKPLPWPAVSWTHIETFEQCPYRYYHQYVIKSIPYDPTTKHPAAIWGDEVHKALAKSIVTGAPMAAQFAGFQKYADRIRKLPGEKIVEQKWGLTDTHRPCDFFAPDVRFRAIMDVLVVDGDRALGIDHKTGKEIKPTSQLHFAAPFVFARYPKVKELTATFSWLQHNSFTDYLIRRDAADQHWQPLQARIDKITMAIATRDFPKIPSRLCRWCPVKSCKHNPKYTP